MPSAPVVMLPQVPLSGVQPPASAKPMPLVPLASQASVGASGFTGQLWRYSAASVPQCAERPR